ncbi:hypothetical protein SBRY_60549 [Actinacidiphila bryophytorum]|uniref:Uncharacterized protein n=1 Tax=Actinacidiphila bryophytorum TaxID=1436133 RepID=A0A9W4MKE0_9ACTN|nr:hypothetical protein SBRY_60549 [Actinacidiphila bryophytorum]
MARAAPSVPGTRNCGTGMQTSQGAHVHVIETPFADGGRSRGGPGGHRRRVQVVGLRGHFHARADKDGHGEAEARPLPSHVAADQHRRPEEMGGGVQARRVEELGQVPVAAQGGGFRQPGDRRPVERRPDEGGRPRGQERPRRRSRRPGPDRPHARPRGGPAGGHAVPPERARRGEAVLRQPQGLDGLLGDRHPGPGAPGQVQPRLDGRALRARGGRRRLVPQHRLRTRLQRLRQERRGPEERGA